MANLESTSVVVIPLASALSVALTAHTAFNLTKLRSPHWNGNEITEKVSVLIPARNEETHIALTIESIRNQSGLTNFEIIILDDQSTDSTAAIVQQLADQDSRITLVSNTTNPPEGWLGKPHACELLSKKATGSVLVFVDADVSFEPQAIAACIELMREMEFGLVAPYPQQLADSTIERLVQPLVIWSWATTMPLDIAEKSLRTSLSAANGQFLIFDSHAYRAAGGHGSVSGEVLEDIALMRSLKRSGSRCVTVNGSELAHCRMYENAKELTDGYTKSLWNAFGSPVGSIAVNSLLAFAYLVPPAAMIASRKKSHRLAGAVGYFAGVTGRALVAKKTGSKVLPDSLAHPVSIAIFIGLNAVSWSRHLRGTNTWKGRVL
ncbi:MAG: glycosyltransferase family 2 protein [Actinomycetia bacterium]|nr:glycosyltransferase family 2 protein [Actinomycetes bacterium]